MEVAVSWFLIKPRYLLDISRIFALPMLLTRLSLYFHNCTVQPASMSILISLLNAGKKLDRARKPTWLVSTAVTHGERG